MSSTELQALLSQTCPNHNSFHSSRCSVHILVSVLTPLSFPHVHSVILMPTSAILSSWFSNYTQNLLHLTTSIATFLLQVIIIFTSIVSISVLISLLSLFPPETILKTKTQSKVGFFFITCYYITVLIKSLQWLCSSSK